MTGPITDGAALRGSIDAVDAEILGLLLRRHEVSRQIQRARAGAGDGPVSHEREPAICDRYAEALGEPFRQHSQRFSWFQVLRPDSHACMIWSCRCSLRCLR